MEDTMFGADNVEVRKETIEETSASMIRDQILDEIAQVTEKYRDTHVFLISIGDELGGAFTGYGSSSKRTLAFLGKSFIYNLTKMLSDI
jgi:hypothetical protein